VPKPTTILQEISCHVHIPTDDQTVAAVLAELHSCEYIELLDLKTEKVWDVTTAGRTVSFASAAKPILRKNHNYLNSSFANLNEYILQSHREHLLASGVKSSRNKSTPWLF